MTRPESSAKTAVMTPKGQLTDDGPRSHGVRSTPTVTGMVDWKTIAPATFPSAMTSLLSRVQMRLFAASGSSVASGARISDSRSGLKPSACETSPTKSAKNRAPTKIAANAMSVCAMRSMTSVPSMNGAPRIAPTPISSPSAVFVNTIATMGMSVSGVAVPNAARMLPVAPWLSFSLTPSHSTPFVKTSAPARIRAKAPTISATSRALTPPSCRVLALGGRRRRRAQSAADRLRERVEQEHDREDHDDAREWAREEDPRVARAGDEALAKLPLGRVAEHERDHERRERVLHLPEPVADEPEHDGDGDVEERVVQRVRADDRDDDDERRDDRVGHAHDHREHGHQEQAQQEREEVPHVDARDEAPHEV